MNQAEWTTLTEGREPLSDALVARCHAVAKQYRSMEQSAYSGFSGSDRAEAPALGITADLFCLVAAGADRDEVSRWARDKWTTYARQTRERVANAKKLSHGPRRGQSVIEHQWVSDEHIDAKIRHVFSCVEAWGKDG